MDDRLLDMHQFSLGDVPSGARPWPVPREPWLTGQTWHEVLFAHWRVPTAALRAVVPRSLELDTFEGEAWVGVVPFRMSGVRPRFTPALPWFSAFPELNVRTYVRAEGVPGVWFLSLDAANPVAVAVARNVFALPYFRARMACVRVGGAVRYRSVRTHAGAPPARFRACYAPLGPVQPVTRASLDEWLTARYCLYAVDSRSRVWRTEIDHSPWPLQPARAHFSENSMVHAAGIDLPTEPALLHYARRLDVRVWRGVRVRA